MPPSPPMMSACSVGRRYVSVFHAVKGRDFRHSLAKPSAMSYPSPTSEDIRRTKALVRAVATEFRQHGAPSLETANHAWLESQPQSLWPLLDATVAASAARKRDE